MAPISVSALEYWADLMKPIKFLSFMDLLDDELYLECGVAPLSDKIAEEPIYGLFYDGDDPAGQLIDVYFITDTSTPGYQRFLKGFLRVQASNRTK